MRELALHILDLIENAVTAGASLVAVEIAMAPEWDLMHIVVEDNGPGLNVPAEQAMDPFYTTKKGKKMGLGLSLFRFRIEQAGGELSLERSVLGGLAVRASLRLTHIDRNPIGDLASTLSSVLAANPDLELRCYLKVGERQQTILSNEVTRELVLKRSRVSPGIRINRFTVARKFFEQIKEGIEALEIKE